MFSATNTFFSIVTEPLVFMMILMLSLTLFITLVLPRRYTLSPARCVVPVFIVFYVLTIIPLPVSEVEARSHGSNATGGARGGGGGSSGGGGGGGYQRTTTQSLPGGTTLSTQTYGPGGPGMSLSGPPSGGGGGFSGGNGGNGSFPTTPGWPIVPADPTDPDTPEDPAPPEPTTVDVRAVVNGNSYSPHAYILTTDTVEVEWEASGSGNVQCQAQYAMPEIEDGAPSGSVTVDQSDFDLGQTRRYGVQCLDTLNNLIIGEVESGYVDITVPDASLELLADPETVRQGATTTIGWEITLDETPSDHDDSAMHPMNCRLFGATSDTFDAADEPQGERSAPVFNFFVNTLQCTEPVTGSERSASSDVEVIPAVQER